jgi:hypothetical protein
MVVVTEPLLGQERRTQPQLEAKEENAFQLPHLFLSFHTHSGRADAPPGSNKRLLKRLSIILGLELPCSAGVQGSDLELLLLEAPRIIDELQQANITFVREYFTSHAPGMAPALIPDQIRFGEEAFVRAGLAQKLSAVGALPLSAVNLFGSQPELYANHAHWQYILLGPTQQQYAPELREHDFGVRLYGNRLNIPCIQSSRPLLNAYLGLVKGEFSPARAYDRVMETLDEAASHGQHAACLRVPLEDAIRSRKGMRDFYLFCNLLKTAHEQEMIALNGFDESGLEFIHEYFESERGPLRKLCTQPFVYEEQNYPWLNDLNEVTANYASATHVEKRRILDAWDSSYMSCVDDMLTPYSVLRSQCAEIEHKVRCLQERVPFFEPNTHYYSRLTKERLRLAEAVAQLPAV